MKTLRNIWKIKELRQKILFTVMILLIVRVGSAIPNPFLQKDFVNTIFDRAGGAGELFSIMSGNAFQQMTLFAMGVTPYINASIIITLLAVVIPRLEEIQKEGETGHKIIEKYTLYLAIALAVIQSAAMSYSMRKAFVTNIPVWISIVASVIIYSTASIFIVWIGKKVEDKGIGNGVSLIIFANITSRIPSMLSALMTYGLAWWKWVLLVLIFVALIGFTVVLSLGERRIQIQYAQKMQGRRFYGGQASFIPVKVNLSGVLPIIFAISILTFPGIVTGFITQHPAGWWAKVVGALNTSHPIGAALYVLLIIGFTFFQASIQFNPTELARNLQKNGGFIPGYRPGRPTEDYIRRVSNCINTIGSVGLAFLALIPILMSFIFGVDGLSIGGSSMLILVGVALETVKQVESELAYRHYDGFLTK